MNNYWDLLSITIRSAYHMAVEMFSSTKSGRATTSIVQKGWKQIWEVQVIPRVRMFLWGACAHVLPAKTIMVRKGCSSDTVCVLCGEEEETIENLLFYCNQVRHVWYSSSQIYMNHKYFVTFKDFLWTCMERYPVQCVSVLAYIAWEIWNRRNAVSSKRKNFVSMDSLESKW